MSLNLQMHAEAGVLYVAATGEFLLADGREKFLSILDAVDRNSVTKVLFDGRAGQRES